MNFKGLNWATGIFILLAAIYFITSPDLSSLSCKPKRQEGIIISSEQIDTARAIAKRYYETKFSTGDSLEFSVRASSLQHFWNSRSILTPCDDKKEYMRELSKKASDTASIISVDIDHRKYNAFTKTYQKSFGSIHVFLDTSFSVMIVDCDSGLVYKNY